MAKDFFNSTITMEIVNQAEEVERTGKREHVVFLVTQREALPERPEVKDTLSSTKPCPAKSLRHDVPLTGKEVKCTERIPEFIVTTNAASVISICKELHFYRRSIKPLVCAKGPTGRWSEV